MGALGHPLPEETRRLESEYKISGHQRLKRVPQLAYSHSCSWEKVTLAVTPQGGTSGVSCTDPSWTLPCFSSFGRFSLYPFTVINREPEHSTSLSSVSHPSQLLSLRVVVGILQFATGISREGSLVGTVPSNCTVG